jgi:hypothetical protein
MWPAYVDMPFDPLASVLGYGPRYLMETGCRSIIKRERGSYEEVAEWAQACAGKARGLGRVWALEHAEDAFAFRLLFTRERHHVEANRRPAPRLGFGLDLPSAPQRVGGHPRGHP